MLKMKKNKTTIDSKPKTHIKGEIGVVLGLLILGFVTITLIIRLFGMIFYDWHDRGAYFLMYTHSHKFELLPGEQEIRNYGLGFTDQIPDYNEVILEGFEVDGYSDSLVICYVLGFPIEFKDKGVGVAGENTYFFLKQDDIFEWDESADNESKEELLSTYKKTMIKMSIIELVIILIQLYITILLIKLLLKTFLRYIKEDQLGIQPL